MRTVRMNLAATTMALAGAVIVFTPAYAGVNPCQGQPNGTRICDNIGDCYHTEAESLHYANIDGIVCEDGVPDFNGDVFKEDYHTHPDGFDSACEQAMDDCDNWAGENR